MEAAEDMPKYVIDGAVITRRTRSGSGTARHSTLLRLSMGVGATLSMSESGDIGKARTNLSSNGLVVNTSVEKRLTDPVRHSSLSRRMRCHHSSTMIVTPFKRSILSFQSGPERQHDSCSADVKSNNVSSSRFENACGKEISESMQWSSTNASPEIQRLDRSFQDKSWSSAKTAALSSHGMETFMRFMRFLVRCFHNFAFCTGRFLVNTSVCHAEGVSMRIRRQCPQT